MKKKTIITTTVIIGVLAIIAWVVSLFGATGNTHEYFVLLDVTEENMQHPNAAILKSHFEKFPPEDGIIIHFIPITEIRLNPISMVELSTISNSFFNNEDDRKGEVKTFFNDVDTILNELLQKRISRDGSVIYPLLVSILEDTVKTQPYASRTILLYSDLMEYSSVANFYQTKEINTNTISHWKNLFAEAFPLPVLENIDLYIIHHPETKAEGIQFDLLSAMYKELLAPSGVDVHISASTPQIF